MLSSDSFKINIYLFVLLTTGKQDNFLFCCMYQKNCDSYFNSHLLCAFICCFLIANIVLRYTDVRVRVIFIDFHHRHHNYFFLK